MKILLILSLMAAPALADGLGLFPSAKEYDAETFSGLGFVEFTSSRPGTHAPIALNMSLNGKRITNQFVLFNEKLLARLPDGKPILVDGDRWDFPVGTMVAHELRFNDRERTLFEMRVVEKLDAKNWGYGTYVPEGGKLVLRHHEASENKEFRLTAEDAKEWGVRLMTVPQRACARCHSTSRLNAEPVTYFEESGPCEFQPKNANLRTEWAARFFGARGWSPFVERKP